jgi:superfamily II DNA or RNA helicase
MINIRNKLQAKAVEKYFSKGIYFLAPRFGKVKTTFLLCEKNNWTNIKIYAPRKDIFDGWIKDKEKFKFKGELSFCTFTSFKKELQDNSCLVVIDEIQEASNLQLIEINRLIKNKNSVALSGTMTNKTLDNIFYKTGMKVCHKYTIEEGVEDGILADYNIHIHSVELDNDNKNIKTSKGFVSEKKRYEQLTWLKNKLNKENKPTFFIDLKIINLLQNSNAKKEKTISLLKKYKDKRILVFCGTTETADNLNIPVYHSKTKEKNIFTSFCNGEGNHLATIKMMQSGVTILPISLGIINYMSGNPEDSAQKICRFLGIEYDNLDKKAKIHIISSDTEFEKKRLETALMFFDKNKIKYL